jgi:hypothetical protein
MRRLPRRGFLLVFALLLSVLICLLALSMLSLRRAGYAASQSAVQAVQARALARSGISDVWTKVSKDPLFPAGVGDRQLRFSFREAVRDDSGDLVGFYTVVVDRSYRLSHRVLRIESLGVAGSGDNRSPRHRIYAELSINPDDFGFKVWQEGVEARL